MKFSIRKCLLMATLIAVIIAVGLGFSFLQRQKQKYHKAKATYYALAAAMEREDITALKKLAPRDRLEDLQKLAKPYGGIRKLGKLMRKSPEVKVVLHAPLDSFEVIGKIEKRHLVVLISTRSDQPTAHGAFFF